MTQFLLKGKMVVRGFEALILRINEQECLTGEEKTIQATVSYE